MLGYLRGGKSVCSARRAKENPPFGKITNLRERRSPASLVEGRGSGSDSGRRPPRQRRSEGEHRRERWAHEKRGICLVKDGSGQGNRARGGTRLHEE